QAGTELLMVIQDRPQLGLRSRRSPTRWLVLSRPRPEKPFPSCRSGGRAALAAEPDRDAVGDRPQGRKLPAAGHIPEAEGGRRTIPHWGVGEGCFEGFAGEGGVYFDCVPALSMARSPCVTSFRLKKNAQKRRISSVAKSPLARAS